MAVVVAVAREALPLAQQVPARLGLLARRVWPGLRQLGAELIERGERRLGTDAPKLRSHRQRELVEPSSRQRR